MILVYGILYKNMKSFESAMDCC